MHAATNWRKWRTVAVLALDLPLLLLSLMLLSLMLLSLKLLLSMRLLSNELCCSLSKSRVSPVVQESSYFFARTWLFSAWSTRRSSLLV